jgi:hypothetical protein
MEPGNKTASSLEVWLAMLEKAQTNEEFTAVALALPDRKLRNFGGRQRRTHHLLSRNQRHH